MMGRMRGTAIALAGLGWLVSAAVGGGGAGWAAAQHGRGAVGQEAHDGLVRSVKIYLVAIGDSGRSGRKIGCGDSLVAVSRPIPATAAPLRAALTLLLSDHHRFSGQSGLYNSLYQSRLRVDRAVVVDGTATVRLSGRTALGGVCDDPRFMGQLRATVGQFRSVRRVFIFINGRSLASWLSEKGG